MPCGEKRCGCDRSITSPGCTSKEPGKRCVPCRYRDLEYIQGVEDLDLEQKYAMLNHSHTGEVASHIVTFTALESGVKCRLERDFNYHCFYRIHATQQQTNLAEEFLIDQVGAPYNLIGSRCNFMPCCPCMRWCGWNWGTTWDELDPEMDFRTGRVIRYSEKIEHWEWFCSEIAAATFCHIGLDGFTPETRVDVGCSQQPCTTSPDDLLHLILLDMKRRKGSDQIVFSEIPSADVMRMKEAKKTQ